MGQRSATQSVAAVMAAFLERRTWTQAELARAVELRPEALRTVLRDLLEAGVPLESEKAHPHVYWRIAKGWYPGGVLFKAEHVPDLLRQLSHLPKSSARDRLLAVVMEQLPARAKLTAAAPVVSRQASEQEEQYLPVVEEAAARRLPLLMKYVTASRGGKIGDRHASVHVVEVGPPARFIATCHRNGDLRRFRVDGIVRARVDADERFRDCDPGELAAFRAASLDGYKGAGPPAPCSFFVREPESSWVANNLLEGMRVETLHGGIRVSVETSALLRLAQFVVKLGDAARPEEARKFKRVSFQNRAISTRCMPFNRPKADQLGSRSTCRPSRTRTDSTSSAVAWAPAPPTAWPSRPRPQRQRQAPTVSSLRAMSFVSRGTSGRGTRSPFGGSSTWPRASKITTRGSARGAFRESLPTHTGTSRRMRPGC